MKINIKDIDYNNWEVKFVRNTAPTSDCRKIWYNKEKKLYMKI